MWPYKVEYGSSLNLQVTNACEMLTISDFSFNIYFYKYFIIFNLLNSILLINVAQRLNCFVFYVTHCLSVPEDCQLAC